MSTCPLHEEAAQSALNRLGPSSLYVLLLCALVLRSSLPWQQPPPHSTRQFLQKPA